MTRKDMDNLAVIVAALFAGVVVSIFVVIGVGWAAMRFWNLFAPEVLGLPEASWRNGMGFVGFLICVRVCLAATVSTKPRR